MAFLQEKLLSCERFSGGDGNFVLSTSLSGYRTVHGGMGPMTQDGYGVFYTMENDR